jgi:hypothetical protein
MAESIKQARLDTGDDRRPVRRDPRAEPETLPPDGVDKRDASAPRLDVTGIGPHSASIRTPPESVTRTSAAPRIESMLIVDEHAAVSARRPVDIGPSLDVAGASGIATLRRQLAALQLQLSDAQGQLAREQEGRATDAEEMARVLTLLSSSEAENDALVGDLEREKAFVEELRVSVREKYEDCNLLRLRLADTESLIAKELDEAADRHALTERAERAEHEASDLSKQLEASRASEESVRLDLATVSTQLNELRHAQETLEAELTKSNATLKNANMKAFAANKQLESWKSESARTMEQTRTEQSAALAKMTEEHAKAAEVLRRQADDANALALALEKQMAGATEKLALATKSLEALEEVERQVLGLREQAKTARRNALDHAAQARKSLLPAARGLVASPSVASTVVLPARPPAPVAVASLKPTPTRTTRPPPGALVSKAAHATRDITSNGSEAPALEIGEIEMGADDLVLELTEARKRDGL